MRNLYFTSTTQDYQCTYLMVKLYKGSLLCYIYDLKILLLTKLGILIQLVYIQSIHEKGQVNVVSLMKD